jgi:hypothetical protein
VHPAVSDPSSETGMTRVTASVIKQTIVTKVLLVFLSALTKYLKKPRSFASTSFLIHEHKTISAVYRR